MNHLPSFTATPDPIGFQATLRFEMLHRTYFVFFRSLMVSGEFRSTPCLLFHMRTCLKTPLYGYDYDPA
uniref:Uncharacterized protein n=1 Tax=Picea glauca TaxID=3330 RepID=A0A117NGF4_PICGL|nr:hypothetical protein ABT39_MTgene1380 [Picea glauca]QHR89464.1 hypothetical protein Q903MT_gene3485 [Picea sitchensis]